jgi:foldase protein PrsA
MVGIGTVAVLVAGGLATQFWKAQPGSAAEETGSAKVNSAAPKRASTAKVAKVGDEYVTEDMLARECIARHGKEVLDDLINRLIIQQACEAENKVVTQAEVENEIVEIAKKFNLDPVEWQKMLLAERNITPEQYRLSVIWPMLALRKLAETDAKDEISDDELTVEFERQYGERVKCRMILSDNLRRAQDVWNQAKKNPDNFERLAQDHSIDPNSKSLGGAIPPIPMHSGNEAVEKAVFKLEEGEISGVVEFPTPAGTRYAILKCEGRTEPVVKHIDDVREELYQELVERKTQENIAKVFEKIKAETRVDNYLTRSTSGPDTSSVKPAAKSPSGARSTGIKQTSGEQPAATRTRTATSGKATRN